MRIMPKVVTPITGNEPREPRPAAATTTAPAAQTASGTIVRLSSAGAGATSATSAAAASSEHGPVRVAEIKAALARGTYPIDRDILAQHIVDDEDWS